MISLRSLLDEEVIDAAMQRLDERANGESTDRPHKILNLLKVIGRDFLKLDAPVMGLIADSCRALRPEQNGMHSKNIERLAPLLGDPRRLRQFFDLPERLMRRAIAMDELKGGRQPALIAQYAVALELWQTVPVRIGNMVGLELERHFLTLAIREGHAMIVIPGEEMKNGKPQTYPVMKRSCSRIRGYLDRFRPRLQGAANPWLFPGRNGQHKHVVVLSGQISKLIKDELGLDFHAHLFRHLAGELYLTACEGDYEGVANLLGHEGTATARLYYTTPRVRAAVERLDTVVLRLGKKLPAPARGRKVR